MKGAADAELDPALAGEIESSLLGMGGMRSTRGRWRPRLPDGCAEPGASLAQSTRTTKRPGLPDPAEAWRRASCPAECACCRAGRRRRLARSPARKNLPAHPREATQELSKRVGKRTTRIHRQRT